MEESIGNAEEGGSSSYEKAKSDAYMEITEKDVKLKGNEKDSNETEIEQIGNKTTVTG